jgi:single-strand DNA-binding protein
MNFIELLGNVGNDAEVRHTPNGQKLTTFSLATRSRKGGQDITTWYRVTVWGDRFDKMVPYIKKGSALIVRGSLNPPEVYTDKNGTAQVRLEVTAEILSFSPFGGKPQSENATGNLADNGSHSNNSPSYNSSSPFGDFAPMSPMQGQNSTSLSQEYAGYASDNTPF